MRYLLWLELDGFYLGSASPAPGRSPRPPGRGRAWPRAGAGEVAPRALIHERKVWDACAEARALGVRVGMRASEARALLDGVGQVLDYEPEPYLSAQEAWLRKAGRYSDVIEPVHPHCAWIDLSAHPCPHDLAERLVNEVQAEAGCPARWGAGRCRWVAQLAARVRDPSGQAVRDPLHWVAPLPVSHLHELSPEARARLRRLGCLTIGSVRALTRPTLVAQFGEEAERLELAASGEGDAYVRPLYPRACLAERREIHVTDALTWDAARDHLAVRLGRRIRAAGQAGKHLEAMVEMEDARILHRARTFVRPLADPATTRAAARLLFPNPPEGTCTALRLRTAELNLAAELQRGLEGLRSGRERDAHAAHAVASVREVYGEHAVELASRRPVERRVALLRAWQEAFG